MTNKQADKEDSKSAPVWIIQLLALAALVFFVWLEATIPEFVINKTILLILAGAILPVDLIVQYIRYITGGKDR